MLDKKYIKAYNSIKADDNLKEKILTRSEDIFRANTRKFQCFRYRSAKYIAAACAIAFIGLGILSMQISEDISTELLYKGNIISSEPTALNESGAMAVSFGAKSITASGLPLEIKAGKNTKISVSDGELQIFDYDGGELLFVGTDFTADKDVMLFWNLATANDPSPRLVTDSDTAYSEYILEESKEAGYIIRLATRISI